MVLQKEKYNNRYYFVLNSRINGVSPLHFLERNDIVFFRCGGKAKVAIACNPNEVLSGVRRDKFTVYFQDYATQFTYWDKDWSGAGNWGNRTQADPDPLDIVKVYVQKEPNAVERLLRQADQYFSNEKERNLVKGFLNPLIKAGRIEIK